MSDLGLHVRLLGAKQLAKKFRVAGELAQKAAGAGAYNVGLVVLRKAVRNAPKKWGVLRGSGYLTLPRNGKCRVGFGGPAAAYAWVQHERMDFRHKEGGPKYLERAVETVRPRAGDIYLKIVKHVLQGKPPPPPSGGAPHNPWATARAKARKEKARKARSRARQKSVKKAVKAVKATVKAAGKVRKRAVSAGRKALKRAARALGKKRRRT